MFMEDVITKLAIRPATVLAVLTDDWTTRFLVSISENVALNKPLSTRQGDHMVRVVRRLRDAGVMRQLGFSDATTDAFIESPRYKIAPYPSSDIPKEVRYLGNNILGFRCKWIKDLVAEFRDLGERGSATPWRLSNYVTYNRQQRLWLVPVTDDTYYAIIKIIREHAFDVDDAVIDYLYLCDQSKQKPSVFAHYAEGNQFVAIVRDNPIIDAWLEHVMFCEVA